MSSNSFFVDGGRNLYGEVFGSAIQYDIERDTATGKPEVRIKPQLIQPESIYFHGQSKFELVCECVKKLAVSIGDFDLAIYGIKLPISRYDSMSIIAGKIKKKQMSFISIDETLDKSIQREIKNCINDFLERLDIF